MGAEPRPEPDSGKPTVRDRRGACGIVDHGGTRNPWHNRKGAGRKLSTYRCARRISIPTSARDVLWEPAVGDCRRRPGAVGKGPKGTSLAAYPTSRTGLTGGLGRRATR